MPRPASRSPSEEPLIGVRQIMSASAVAVAPSPTSAAPSRAASPDESPDADELRRAIESYKRRSGRNFPTWSEVLEVFRGMGYAKRTPAQESPAKPWVRIRPGDP